MDEENVLASAVAAAAATTTTTYEDQILAAPVAAVSAPASNEFKVTTKVAAGMAMTAHEISTNVAKAEAQNERVVLVQEKILNDEEEYEGQERGAFRSMRGKSKPKHPTVGSSDGAWGRKSGARVSQKVKQTLSR